MAVEFPINADLIFTQVLPSGRISRQQQSYNYPFITGAIHFAYGYVFFGCVVFAFFYVATCVPETKGLSLEDVDELYRHFTPGTAFLSKFSNANKAKKLAEGEGEEASQKV